MSNQLKRISERLDDSKTSKIEKVQRQSFISLLNKLPLSNNSKAISISTGDGCWDSLVFDKEPRIVKIEATDIVSNPVNVDDQVMLSNMGEWIFTQVVKESVLPFKEGLFDLVYHHDVLEHVQKPFLFINEQYRVLRKNGFLVLSTPNLFRPANIAKLLIGNLSFPNKIGFTEGIGDYIHIKEYTKNDIVLLLEEAGFVDVTVKSLYLGIPILNICLTKYPKNKIGKCFSHYLIATARKA